MKARPLDRAWLQYVWLALRSAYLYDKRGGVARRVANKFYLNKEEVDYIRSIAEDEHYEAVLEDIFKDYKEEDGGRNCKS